METLAFKRFLTFHTKFLHRTLIDNDVDVIVIQETHTEKGTYWVLHTIRHMGQQHMSCVTYFLIISTDHHVLIGLRFLDTAQ